MTTYQSPTATATTTTYSSSSSSPTSSTRMTHEHLSYQPPKHDQVPNAVQNLLLSTKRLQEVLRLWSVEQATEGDVSDLYVQIGNELNLTISAFAKHQIDLSDIHSVPGDLRVVLERCLSEDPSPEVLEMFMPEIRLVLFKLLKGLQNRQESWQLAIQGHHQVNRNSG